jgi:hypothetical protein
MVSTCPTRASAWAAVIGAQRMPVVCRTMKAICSAVTVVAAMIRSPSSFAVGVVDHDDQAAGGEFRDHR